MSAQFGFVLFGVGASGFGWDRSSGPMEKEAVDIGIDWLDLIQLFLPVHLSRPHPLRP